MNDSERQGSREGEESDTESVVVARNVLGVARQHSYPEIRRAYRSRLLETHPDKRGDTEQFTQVRQSYQRLAMHYRQRSSNKRSSTDSGDKRERTNGDDRKRSSVYGEHSAKAKREDTVLDLYDRRYLTRNGRKTIDIHVNIGIELKDLFSSHRRTIKYDCLTRCSECKSSGFTRANETLCTCCRGTRFVSRTMTKTIDIPPSAFQGSRFVFAASSHRADEPITPGDLVVSLYELEHPVWSRVGLDAYACRRISLGQSIAGFVWSLAMLNSAHAQNRYEFRKAPQTNSNDLRVAYAFRLRGQGFYSRCSSSSETRCEPRRGDAFLLLCVQDFFRPGTMKSNRDIIEYCKHVFALDNTSQEENRSRRVYRDDTFSMSASDGKQVTIERLI